MTSVRLAWWSIENYLSIGNPCSAVDVIIVDDDDCVPLTSNAMSNTPKVNLNRNLFI